MNENYWERFDTRLTWLTTQRTALQKNGTQAYYAPLVYELPQQESIFASNPFAQIEIPPVRKGNKSPVSHIQLQYRRYNINTNPTILKFQKAETMQEAVNYARTKLGIKNFNMQNDLELANWVNEGLTAIYNKYKGKVPMPSNVIKDGSKDMVGDAYYNLNRDTLAIAPDNKKKVLTRLLRNIENTWESSNRPLTRWYKRALKEDYSQIPYIDPKFQKQVAQHIQEFQHFPEIFEVTDVKQLYHEINALLETKHILKTNPMKLIADLYNNPKYKKALESPEFKSLVQISRLDKDEQKQEFYKILDKLKEKGINAYVEPQKFAENNKFHVIFHEYGHFMHFKTTSFESLKEHTDEFKSNPRKQNTAEQVSGYAKSEPMEFVAEVYAGMLNGVHYPPDVLRLYHSYNGPALPQ